VATKMREGLLVNLAEKIRSLTPSADISEVMSAVEALLDQSVAAKAYVIRAAELEVEDRYIDLSQINFEALAARFRTGGQRLETERLQGIVTAKLTTMVRLNPTRIGYMERFQRLIDQYNAGSLNVEEFFRQLVEFARSARRPSSASPDAPACRSSGCTTCATPTARCSSHPAFPSRWSANGSATPRRATPSTPTSTCCPACKPRPPGSSNRWSRPLRHQPISRRRSRRKPERSAGRRRPEDGRSPGRSAL
jgi:hypothetical protein